MKSNVSHSELGFTGLMRPLGTRSLNSARSNRWASGTAHPKVCLYYKGFVKKISREKFEKLNGKVSSNLEEHHNYN